MNYPYDRNTETLANIILGLSNAVLALTEALGATLGPDASREVLLLVKEAREAAGDIVFAGDEDDDDAEAE